MPSHPTLRFPTLHSSSASSSSSEISTIGGAMTSRVERVVLSDKPVTMPATTVRATTSARSHPMMQMTLPLDDDDDSSSSDLAMDPLSSPQGPALHEVSGATSRFAGVKAPKKRVFSAPSLTRSFSKGASDKMPSLSRSSSASAATATATRFVSKMAPMLRRVVSGSTSSASASASTNAATVSDMGACSDAPVPPVSPRSFLESDEDARDSLLFMMQVPVVRRKSHIPLMSLSHADE